MLKNRNGCRPKDILYGKSARERLIHRVSFKEGVDCWLLKSFRKSDGYSLVRDDQGKSVLAHRLIYEIDVGPIPPGLFIDHLCRNRNCVNPKHLEPVTLAENCRRGMMGRLRKKCTQGHDYDEENTEYRYGHRACKKCRSYWASAEYRKKRSKIWNANRRKKAAKKRAEKAKQDKIAQNSRRITPGNPFPGTDNES